MKKMMMTLIAMLTMTVQMNAMSFEQARNEALFLTDKMAYELNLTDEQYEAAYEINLDYLMGVTGRADVFGPYWERRNLDLSYILLDWQWEAFLAATYFYRPLYWDAGYWHFAIYARYPHRDYFYFGRPHFYATYRGGHAWHRNGGRSYYVGRREHFRSPGREHFGMHDRWNRGDFRDGRHSSTRITGGPNRGGRIEGNRGGRIEGNRNGRLENRTGRMEGNRNMTPNRSIERGGSTPNRSIDRGNNTTPNRSIDRGTSTPNRSIERGGSSTPNRSIERGSSSTPSRTINRGSSSVPSRNFSSSSRTTSPSRSFGSSSSAPSRSIGSSSSSRSSAPSRSFGGGSSSSRSSSFSGGSSRGGSSFSGGSRGGGGSHSGGGSRGGGGGHFGGRR